LLQNAAEFRGIDLVTLPDVRFVPVITNDEDSDGETERDMSMAIQAGVLKDSESTQLVSNVMLNNLHHNF